MAISTAAKIAISARKPIKKIIAAVLVFLFGGFLFMTIISSMISIFADSDSDSKINSSFNSQETKEYQTIRAYYDEYVNSNKNEMEAIAKKIMNENMAYRTVRVYNPETKKYENKKEEYCKAEVTVKDYCYINTAYVMAYLSCIYCKDYLRDRDINIDKQELFDFWDQINSIKIETAGTEDEPVYTIYNEILPFEEIVNVFFLTDRQKQVYENSVFMISQYIGSEAFEKVSIDINNANMDIPLYYQYSEPWGSKAYGNGTIAKKGCAPTCIAMVFSYLRHENIYPDDIVKYTGNKYYVNGQGSSWGIFAACAGHWGLDCVQIGTSKDKIITALSEGNPVILSMGPGRFTSSGHFIVLTGINSEGLVTVNDPNDNNKKNFKDKEFGLSQILNEAKGGWYFE